MSIAMASGLYNSNGPGLQPTSDGLEELPAMASKPIGKETRRIMGNSLA